jgi:hypothetical protein
VDNAEPFNNTTAEPAEKPEPLTVIVVETSLTTVAGTTEVIVCAA